MRVNKLLFICFLLVSHWITISGQRLNFRHIAGDQGLTSVTSWSSTVDKYGFIWLASVDGLVRFDGSRIQYYRVDEYPELPQDHVDYVYCDSRNQIWVCTSSGLAKVDENRVFKKQRIVDSLETIDVDAVFESEKGKIFALTAKGAFAQIPGDTAWIRQFWWDTIKDQGRWRSIVQFDRERVMIVLPGKGVYLINTVKQKLDAMIPIKESFSVMKFDDKSVLVGSSGSFKLHRVFLNAPDSLIAIPSPKHFTSEFQHAQIRGMKRAIDGSIYIVTEAAGMVILDSTLTHYTVYQHDPLNPNSLTTNSLRNIFIDSSGMLVITSTEGINYTNITHNATEYINYLKTSDGHIYHERVVSAAEDHYGKLWLCFVTNVLIYDPVTRLSTAIRIPSNIQLKKDGIEPTWIECDSKGRMWIALDREGILVYNKDKSFNRLISYPGTPGSISSLNKPRVIKEGFDGFMYIGTESGLVRIQTETFHMDTFTDDPGMRPLLKKRIVDILPRKEDIWVSSSPQGAAWHYVYSTGKLNSYTINEGLVTNRIYSLSEGIEGRINIGSFEAFSVIDQNGKIENWSQGNGLIAKRVEAIETAPDGNVWIANSYNLIKYDPRQETFTRIGAQYGMPHMNFIIMASAAFPSGKLFFGTNKGFLLLDPSEIEYRDDSMKLHVFYKDHTRKEIECSAEEKLIFNYGTGQPSFFFAVSDIMRADQMLYKYRLTGPQESPWSDPSYNSHVDFNLDPGKYTLEVMGFDGVKWSSMKKPVEMIIRPPWWNQGWFIILLSAVAIALLWYYFTSRINKYKKEAIIARQISDLESRALRAQMNPHFVFNSLNAIQECIVTGRIDEAYTYLSKFSRLLRLVLEHSDLPDVSLQDELEVLDLYISLEKLRFKNEMEYQIELSEDLDTEEVRIPPMLIQPHIENAIWHGLRHKDGPKFLKLSIDEVADGYLKVIVEDNGIGRVKSGEMRSKQLGANRHTSKGRALSENRMQLLRKNYPGTALNTIDLYSAHEEPTGTRIELIIPILNHHTQTPQKK